MMFLKLHTWVAEVVDICRYHQPFQYLKCTYVSRFSIDTWHVRWLPSLIKERFEDDNFVPLFNKAHKGAKNAFVGATSDGYLCVWIDLSAEERRVGIS